MATFPDDCLPPESIYDSREALFESINTWAAVRGYAFIARRSTKEKNGRSTITFACDRACIPPTPRERQRKTTTRGTSCPFSVIAKESGEGWTLKHRPDQRFSIHNHEPSQCPSAHPIHRQLSGCTSQLVRHSNAGIAPKEIQTLVRQSGSLATRQDIYNQIAAARRDSCEGQSPIHALVNQLDKEGFWSRIQFTPDGHVTAVLFAHPDSLTYLQAYPELLLLDCTYKTNKYGMPLLDMIGVDAAQRSFCIAFAFLSGETEEDYTWALERLKSLYEQCNATLPSVILTDRCLAVINAASALFPSAATLICIWHANKAVLARCQPAFPDAEKWKEFYRFWHSIINSPIEEVYAERLAEFQQKYVPEHLEEVGYIKTTWLIPFREKLVRAWVDQSTHFGNTATSRVEGIHALIKSYLKRSTFDLFEAWKAIQLALLNQLSELKSNQAKQQLRVPLELSGALYGIVRGWVSYEALRKVEEQRKLLARRDPPPSSTYALQGGLLLDHFHSHWHLIRKGAPKLLLEPRQRIEPVQPRSLAVPRSSTKREPCQFEIVKAQVARARRGPNKCTNCGATGHIRTSRACPLRRWAEVLIDGIFRRIT
ncbi:Mutator-like element transposase, putative [Talaromyces stipitatus ATCC 10500]|uniref:Mutator-like element transposase, putative n=1 Tax=Talaromyces stipitatus (strain ATCC 10500 / CBS 375.48 / QM 6759 / NRRL 1006) TaxID=441959 RepID=B8MAH7_TALSN|nr:Mutator-like element transposase, putative [Talaromyces stipitatus ATCC 10500]EED17401.1 Mutator-like element transposase, putative [Talaromyces stipitatus ATCC 10500]